jgi:hypothetical protein
MYHTKTDPFTGKKIFKGREKQKQIVTAKGKAPGKSKV